MKANAPEKIFLEKEKETDKIHHLWGRTPVVSSFYEHIEYIRADAFIEKIETILRNLWKEDDGHNSEHRICYNKALQDVQIEVDKLEKDTRKWLTQFANCQPED